jgi:hypothetical protein
VIQRFTDWYRSTIERDNRVVFWEHAYAIMSLPVAISLFATRYWQTFWPTGVVIVLTLLASVWSWRQDVIVHSLEGEEGNLPLQRTPMPIMTSIYAITCVVMFIIIVVNWFRTGHY